MCLWIWLGDCTINAPHRFPKRVYMTFSCAVPNKKIYAEVFQKKDVNVAFSFCFEISDRPRHPPPETIVAKKK